MAFYFVTGKLGNGKSLACVGRIREKLISGCMIATNIDIDLVSMFGPTTDKPRVIRIPDKPSVEDLEKIGNANPTYDESKNGLLVLDECGTWFNARNWQDKSRQAVNNWFLHARKLGWDVLLIVQDISLVDSQAREALSEHTVFCKRVDNLSIPFLGTLYKAITGSRLRLPRAHIARVVYGSTPQDMLSDRWIYRGTDLFSCYDTKQMFIADYPHGVHSLLTPWHLKGRYQRPRDKDFYMRLTKIMWKRFKSPLAFGVGTLLGVSMAAAATLGKVYHDAKNIQPVVQVATPVKSDEPTPSDKFFERLKTIRIDSSLIVDGVPRYRFRDDSNGKNAVYYDVEKLTDAGVFVVAVNPCRADLHYKDHQTTVYCL